MGDWTNFWSNFSRKSKKNSEKNQCIFPVTSTKIDENPFKIISCILYTLWNSRSKFVLFHISIKYLRVKDCRVTVEFWKKNGAYTFNPVSWRDPSCTASRVRWAARGRRTLCPEIFRLKLVQTIREQRTHTQDHKERSRYANKGVRGQRTHSQITKNDQFVVFAYLNEAVVLVGGLVFPASESSSGVDLMLFQLTMRTCQFSVALKIIN